MTINDLMDLLSNVDGNIEVKVSRTEFSELTNCLYEEFSGVCDARVDTSLNAFVLET